jgi:hypothetical protein
MGLSLKKMLKRNIIFLLMLSAALCGKAQSSDIMVKGDTLILDNGTKFWIGEEVTLGTGLAADKSFLYVYESPTSIKSLFSNPKKRKSIPVMYSGHAGMIKKFEKGDGHKSDYGYNVIVLQFVDGKQYWCDLVNALTNNEIISAQPGNAQITPLKKEKDSVKTTTVTDTKKKAASKPVTAF